MLEQSSNVSKIYLSNIYRFYILTLYYSPDPTRYQYPISESIQLGMEKSFVDLLPFIILLELFIYILLYQTLLYA